jgi:hypothetical protein
LWQGSPWRGKVTARRRTGKKFASVKKDPDPWKRKC